MRFRRHLCVSLLVYVFFSGVWIGPSQGADVFLEATRPDFQKIPVWVVGFGDGNPPQGSTARIGSQIVDILKADLERTQIFSVLEIPSEDLGFKEADCKHTERLAEFQSSGAAVVTWGRVGRRGSELIMDVCGYDAGRDAVTSGKRYVGGPITMRLLRLMVHRWADQLVTHYTGEAGIAKTKIAFVSENKGSRELFVMDYDGFGPQRVTADGYLSLMPAWSPDQQHLVYTAYRRHNQEIVQLGLSSGKKRTLVSPKGLNITPAISPDGKIMAYASAKEGNSEIYSMNVETQEVVQLTFHKSADLSPSWSPNGREIVFTSDRGGRPQLYIMSADGSNVRRLTFEGDYNAAPAWSPNGEWVAYVCQVPGEGFRLCRISPDGQTRVKITTGSRKEMDDSPTWSPDSRHVAFSSTRNGVSHIFMINSDGTGLEQLTKGGIHHSSPSWSPLQSEAE